MYRAVAQPNDFLITAVARPLLAVNIDRPAAVVRLKIEQAFDPRHIASVVDLRHRLRDQPRDPLDLRHWVYRLTSIGRARHSALHFFPDGNHALVGVALRLTEPVNFSNHGIARAAKDAANR